MNKLLTLISVTTLSLTMAGCANMNNSDVGTITGGVIGGLIGSQFGGGSGRVVATGVGALAGAAIGNRIGSYMDEQDQMRVANAMEYNHAEHWTNERNGNVYTVRPVRTYHRRGRQCREFVQTAYIGGKKQQVYGHACLQPDGSWKIIQ